MFPDQYPDKLVRQGETIEQALPCRFYPNSRSRGMKKVKDGNEVDVMYTISMPEETPNLSIGELVTGYDERGNVIVWNDTVALFHHGQFHCVAYV
ncbi:hypothetical protein M8998_07260 [Sphingobacterium sp. lm-10]|uniref:hypothetical protein n=1 Tax=Sphingobacterium sp. lm-10 TaxID=2944904 RepID=UPI002020C3F0|nr:hypothetical protein [Sphingobacterium sp. lm-10]MCL7987732.1 hypothetical protein [Sphingobacterium sp. lm-10]